MNKPPEEVLDVVIESLEKQPDDWQFKYGEAVNTKLNTRIWMRNKYYGTKLTVGEVKWGDVTMASSLFGCFIQWRRKLVTAAEKACFRKQLNLP